MDCSPTLQLLLSISFEGLFPKLHYALLDDITTLVKSLLIDHQRGSKANNISMGRLRQKAATGKRQTKVPGRIAVRRVVDHNGIQQALAPDFRNQLPFV